MKTQSMKLTGFVAFLGIIVLATYQNCGTTEGESAFGAAQLPQCGNNECANNGTLSVSFPNTTYNINSSSDPVSITGSCSKGTYTSARVDWKIVINASANPVVQATGSAQCTNGAFQINALLSGYSNVPSSLNAEAMIVGINSSNIPTDGPKQLFTITVGAGGAVTCPGPLDGTTASNLQAEVVNAINSSGVVSGGNVPGCSHTNSSIPNAVLQILRVGANASKWGFVRIFENGTQTAGDRVAYFYGAGTAQNARSCFVYFDFVNSCGGGNMYSSPSVTEASADNVQWISAP